MWIWKCITTWNWVRIKYCFVTFFASYLIVSFCTQNVTQTQSGITFDALRKYALKLNPNSSRFSNFYSVIFIIINIYRHEHRHRYFSSYQTNYFIYWFTHFSRHEYMIQTESHSHHNHMYFLTINFFHLLLKDFYPGFLTFYHLIFQTIIFVIIITIKDDHKL